MDHAAVIMFSLTSEGKPPTEMKCEYDENGTYTVKAKQAGRVIQRSFRAKHPPETDWMHTSDMETAMKILEKIKKEFRR